MQRRSEFQPLCYDSELEWIIIADNKSNKWIVREVDLKDLTQNWFTSLSNAVATQKERTWGWGGGVLQHSEMLSFIILNHPGCLPNTPAV